jgi:ABC-2 family transporter protein
VLSNLIGLDLWLGRKVLALNGLLFTSWFAFFLWMGGPGVSVGDYIVLTSVMSVFLPITVIVRESKFSAAALTCSLPVTRRQIVRARYGLSIGLGSCLMVVAIAVGLVCPWSHLAVAKLVAPRALLLALSMIVLEVALLLPFLLRFGWIGIIALLIALQVLGVVALTLTRLLGLGTAFGLGIKALSNALRSLYANLGDPIFVAVWAAVLILVAVASCALSTWLYERRNV